MKDKLQSDTVVGVGQVRSLKRLSGREKKWKAIHLMLIAPHTALMKSGVPMLKRNGILVSVPLLVVLTSIQ